MKIKDLNVKAIAKGWWVATMSNDKEIEIERKRRLEICDNCEYKENYQFAHETKYFKGGKCGLCDCPLYAKASQNIKICEKWAKKLE